MLRLVSPLLAVLLGALSLLTPSLGFAQSADPAQVEELIRQGNELRRSGKDHAAVPVFRKAYDLERSARTAAQLGLVESQMGYWVASEQHLQEALAFSRHPWLEKNRAVVEQTLTKVQSYIGELDVLGTPTGAEVLINGKSVGTLPLGKAVRVAEGPVQVGLQAPGHVSANTMVTLEGGQRHSVRMALQPGANPATVGSAAPSGTSDLDRSGPALGGGADMHDRGAGGSTPGWLRPAAWVATVGAVVGLGVGAYGLNTQWQAQDKFAKHKPLDGACGTTLPKRGGSGCQNLYNDAKSAEKLAIVGFAAGGVMAVGAVVGFLLSADDAPAPRDVAFGASFDRHGGELQLALRF